MEVAYSFEISVTTDTATRHHNFIVASATTSDLVQLREVGEPQLHNRFRDNLRSRAVQRGW
jgi:hypothetical protein